MEPVGEYRCNYDLDDIRDDKREHAPAEYCHKADSACLACVDEHEPCCAENVADCYTEYHGDR